MGCDDMKAAYYIENGGPEVLQYGDLQDPEVRPNSVLIRVEWIPIEGGDLLNRIHTPPTTRPFVPGYVAAGVVQAVGQEVVRFRPGDRVVGFNWSGSHAELFCVPEYHAFPVPLGADLRVASTVPIAFGTAHDALFEYGGLKPREYVLIQGATGGVGIAAVQLAAEIGAIVIGTGSDAEQLARIANFGSGHTINYKNEHIAERCHEITGGKGVDLVLDLAGGQGKDMLVSALKPHGRYSVIGAAEGTLPTFGFFELIRKAMHVFGISLGRDMRTARLHSLISHLTGRVAGGELQMPIAHEFALPDVRDAHGHVADCHPFGRVLMRP
jgi:NADPH2:quinone reductase